MFIASCLNSIPGVTGLHEGHETAGDRRQQLPVINIHNRKAWHDPDYAIKTVTERRNHAQMEEAANGNGLVVDVAFYNAPLVNALAAQFPSSLLIVIFRRCESFVRSATIVEDEDLQPAGWPDREKPLSDREKFISLGRLKPAPDQKDYKLWQDWSAVQRNIWLWTSVNSHLDTFASSNPNCLKLFFEDLSRQPEIFWTDILKHLGLYSAKNLSICVEFSVTRINSRSTYQIGNADSWTPSEQEMYFEKAIPLEKIIYEQYN